MFQDDQNRYKSIVCEEGTYLLELVRYIHLNPPRAGRVKTMEELDHYPWSGHHVILGEGKNNWQERDYVLQQFHDKADKLSHEFGASQAEIARQLGVYTSAIAKAFQKIEGRGK
jgi:putative transposase